MNTDDYGPVPRRTVRELCRALGFNPDAVHSILVEPTQVTVTGEDLDRGKDAPVGWTLTLAIREDAPAKASYAELLIQRGERMAND